MPYVLRQGMQNPRCSERPKNHGFRLLRHRGAAEVRAFHVASLLGFTLEDGLVLQAIIAHETAHQRFAQLWRTRLTFSRAMPAIAVRSP